MESAGKQGSSDTSSDENDLANKSVTTKRSYGCTFCKRGFTNAQALGGHMNIHRKDRAKAKQPTSSAVPKHPTTNEEHINPRYVPTILVHEPSKYYQILETQTDQRNYHVYSQQPVSSPRVLTYGHYDDVFVAPDTSRSQSLSFNGEILGADLSLQTGPTYVDENEIMSRKGIMKEDELDLELRLGLYP